MAGRALAGAAENLASALRGAAIEGKITRISPSADPRTRTFEIETTIPNPKQELKAGMVVSLRLADDAPAAAPAVMLPLTAIVMAPGKEDAFAVFVVEIAARSDPRLKRLTSYSAAGAELAARLGVTVVDPTPILSTPGAPLFQPSGIHYTSRGAEVFARFLFEAVFRKD